jgi:hypothetical protein
MITNNNYLFQKQDCFSFLLFSVFVFKTLFSCFPCMLKGTFQYKVSVALNIRKLGILHVLDIPYDE